MAKAKNTVNFKDNKLLVIVESPNKVKHVKEYLTKAGYNVNVMASVGHIMKLADKKDSYKNSGVYPDEDFRLNLLISEDKKKTVDQLKTATKAADYVYIMTDGDREGELIGWSLIKFLKLNTKNTFRAITHEITPKAVVNAIENPVSFDDNLIEAALARVTIDKLIGYSLSNIAKANIGARSVGRCQSAGLKLVSDREQEIIDFEPETYYELFVNFTKNNKNFRAKYCGTDKERKDKLDDINEIKLIEYYCENSKYIISDAKNKERLENSKPPFCTATFQQEVANRTGLSVKDAMSVAQKLFEAGKINYHRTDDTNMAPEFLPELKNYIESTFGKGMFRTPKVAKCSDTDQNGHECLRVIDPTLTPEKFAEESTNNLQVKVYTIIWQRTIASVLPPAKYSDDIYTINNNGQLFEFKSSKLVDAGFKVVYNKEETKSEEPLEAFTKDEELTVINNKAKGEINLANGLTYTINQTQPPARYSEASLVKQLQDLAIGRPSTYATIVEAVLSTTRGYAKLEDKKIVPTDRGMQLSKFLDKNFSSVISLNYTKEMEENLDKIASGKLSKLDFLKQFFKELEDSINNNPDIKLRTQESDKVCPNCGAKMLVRRSRWGTLFYSCSNYPKCKTALPYDKV